MTDTTEQDRAHTLPASSRDAARARHVPDTPQTLSLIHI